MGLEQSEQSEQKERTPKKAAKAKRKEQSQEVLSDLGNYGINKALIYLATFAAKEDISPKPSSYPNPFQELNKKNPALVVIIKGVADYFGIPAPVLFATFDRESGFKHREIGDYHTKGKSIGIGQFQKGTWSDLNTLPTPEYKEFRAFVNKFYPGKKFERGENLLADIAASAALIKKHGGTRINWKNPAPHRLVRARAKYTGDRDASEQMLIYLGKRQGKIKENYEGFVEDYYNYKKGWEEHQGLVSAK
jgi:hypothetical protein